MALDAAYVLDSSTSERERLVAQAKLHEAEARWLLDQTGLVPGGSAIDVGCGPVGILDLLADCVGPAGQVVGLDRDPAMLAMARDILAEHGLPWVRLVRADAVATGLPRESVDLAHARLLLVNVPNPEDVIAEMAALVRPGGVVALQEVDWLSWTCEPPHPAWDRLRRANEAIWRGRGADVRIGRRLPALLRAAGLDDVQIRAHAPVSRPGDHEHTLLLTFTALHRDAILAAGLLPADQLDALVADLERHLAAPGTLVIQSLLFQAWARKPGPD